MMLNVVSDIQLLTLKHRAMDFGIRPYSVRSTAHLERALKDCQQYRFFGELIMAKTAQEYAAQKRKLQAEVKALNIKLAEELGFKSNKGDFEGSVAYDANDVFFRVEKTGDLTPAECRRLAAFLMETFPLPVPTPVQIP